MKFVLLVVVLVVGGFLITYCKISPDLHYIAMKVGNQPDIDYLVVDLSTRQGVVRTDGQFSTPNDVKAGGFNSDSTQFAAMYHYSGPTTYIQVWNVKTGHLVKDFTVNWWTTDIDLAFGR